MRQSLNRGLDRPIHWSASSGPVTPSPGRAMAPSRCSGRLRYWGEAHKLAKEIGSSCRLMGRQGGPPLVSNLLCMASTSSRTRLLDLLSAFCLAGQSTRHHLDDSNVLLRCCRMAPSSMEQRWTSSRLACRYATVGSSGLGQTAAHRQPPNMRTDGKTGSRRWSCPRSRWKCRSRGAAIMSRSWPWPVAMPCRRLKPPKSCEQSGVGAGRALRWFRNAGWNVRGAPYAFRVKAMPACRYKDSTGQPIARPLLRPRGLYSPQHDALHTTEIRSHPLFIEDHPHGDSAFLQGI